MLLADKFVERTGSHACGEWGAGGEWRGVGGVGEHVGLDAGRRWLAFDAALSGGVG